MLSLFRISRTALVLTFVHLLWASVCTADPVQDILDKLKPEDDKAAVYVSGNNMSVSNRKIKYQFRNLEKAQKGYHIGFTAPSMANFYSGGFLAFTFAAVNSSQCASPEIEKVTDKSGNPSLGMVW